MVVVYSAIGARDVQNLRARTSKIPLIDLKTRINYWHWNCDFLRYVRLLRLLHVFRRTHSGFHDHCYTLIGVFMFKRYFFLASVMLFVAVAFIQSAASQTPPVPIHFDSQPPLTGEVGVPYVYTVHLDGVDTSEASISYGVDPLDPPSFSVNSASGVVSWTPEARGWYSLSLAAVVRYKMHALAMLVEQHFMVAVAGGNGVVEGRVINA